MADSTISQLPLSPYVLDKDYIVVVTGHLQEGSYPRNVKVPLAYIRKYIVRLNLLTNPVSGIDSYYNSGLNILSIWNTGIHAIPGNNVEIQFSQNTPAGGKYGGTGPICHSGIISTTGLNSVAENLIVVGHKNYWPYSGIIYSTGLNAKAGNNIEINFNSNSAAHNQYGGTGGKYSSGIISVTGSNIIDGKGIGYTINTEWPHQYTLFNTEKIKYASSAVTITNSDTGPNSTTSGYNLITLNYNDFYQSKTNESLSLIGTAIFKISNITFGDRPYVPGQGSLNTQKLQELLPLSGTTHNYNYISCDATICGGDTSVFNQTTQFTNITWNESHLANFVSDNNYDYIIDSFVLNIGISGGNSNSLITNICSYPITFKNTNSGDNRPYYNANHCNETYRSNYYPYSVGAIDPMTIMAKVDLTLNSSGINDFNSLALCAYITNVRCSRIYTNSVDLQPNTYCNIVSSVCPGYYTSLGTTTPNTATYISTRCFSNTSATIDVKFIKGENII
jgi:hypothetical protein